MFRGAIDRVDVAPDGHSLRIIDYKTGWSGGKWSGNTGVYHEGRRLQHVLYAMAIEALEDRPVEAMEYHFPTRRGEGEVRRYTRDELREGPELITRLLDMAKQGHFVPTDDESDCRFCDFRKICRVFQNRWGDLTSPPALWGRKQKGEGSPEYAELRDVRSF